MLEKKKLNVENTVIVGIINAQQDEEQSKEYLDELAFLALTAGGKVIQRFTQKISLPNPKTFIGSGKLEEVQAFVEANDVSTVVFDDELTPAQQNNIEKTLRCKILDRTGLILDIFAQRAQTSYARTQVELAQYQYLLPRLKGHLSPAEACMLTSVATVSSHSKSGCFATIKGKHSEIVFIMAAF
jgi:GTPase